MAPRPIPSVNASVIAAAATDTDAWCGHTLTLTFMYFVDTLNNFTKFLINKPDTSIIVHDTFFKSEHAHTNLILISYTVVCYHKRLTGVLAVSA